jgi:hypothetical protein
MLKVLLFSYKIKYNINIILTFIFLLLGYKPYNNRFFDYFFDYQNRKVIIVSTEIVKPIKLRLAVVITSNSFIENFKYQ